MKAITIWQPWASLLACGAKQFETRSWATTYRGPIAIHAAKKDVFDSLALIPIPVALEMKMLLGAEWKDLPTGAVIATAELVNVWHTVLNPGQGNGAHKIGAEDRSENYIIPSEIELAFGDWTPDRYAWELANVKPIPPVPAKGKQGLWEWDGSGRNG